MATRPEVLRPAGCLQVRVSIKMETKCNWKWRRRGCLVRLTDG